MTARGASAGIDGLTVSMVKGATAGNLIADAIKKAVEWTKRWTIEEANMAAHESRMEASGRALAKAYGIAAEAFGGIPARSSLPKSQPPESLAEGVSDRRADHPRSDHVRAEGQHPDDPA